MREEQKAGNATQRKLRDARPSEEWLGQLMRPNPGSCCASFSTLKLLSSDHMCISRRSHLSEERGQGTRKDSNHCVQIMPALTMKDSTKNVENRITMSYLISGLEEQNGAWGGGWGKKLAQGCRPEVTSPAPTGMTCGRQRPGKTETGTPALVGKTVELNQYSEQVGEMSEKDMHLHCELFNL